MTRALRRSFVIILFLMLVGVSPQAFAQYPPCLPGIPCVIPMTPNPATTAVNETNTTGQNANKMVGATCDADFMNQIYARASMEGMRENIMNEVVIRKPDSVLEYTCFNQFILITGGEAGRIFSGSSTWANRTVPIGGSVNGRAINQLTIRATGGIARLRSIMRQLVRRSMVAYINANFWHKYLGSAGAPLNLNGCGQPYTCDSMNQVYYLAKCNNFNSDDQFYNFSDFIRPFAPETPPNPATVGRRFDPRIWPLDSTQPNGRPILCPQIQNSGCRAPTVMPLEDVALNRNFLYVPFDQEIPFTDRLGTTGACMDPIPTGIRVVNKVQTENMLGVVTTSSNNMYDDKFCPNPGCYYDNTLNTCRR